MDLTTVLICVACLYVALKIFKWTLKTVIKIGIVLAILAIIF